MKALFGFLWRGLDGLRKFLHLLLLLIIFGFLAGLLVRAAGGSVGVPAKAALLIQPNGQLVEQLSGDPVQRALQQVQGGENPETLVRDVVDALRAARNDERIAAVVLNLDRMSGGGQPTLSELTHALDEFRKSGKPVIAQGITLLQDQYYLAAHADEIYLDPLGQVIIEGYDRYRMYYKAALDKLGVDFNVFRVGKFKSAVEPYLRQDMSSEDREESAAYLGSLWSSYQVSVTHARKLPADALKNYVGGFASNISAAGGDGAKVALDAKLVTGIKTSLDVEARVVSLVGKDDDTGSFNRIGDSDYLRIARIEGKLKQSGSDKVAVLVAAGEILDGEQPAGMIGGDSTSALIRKARLNDDIKALVLRIDSPGGSVLASEQIYRELNAFKAAGKPLVVSMGDLAASGGYYIAAPANEIFASPATITGSIGIFAAVPTIDRTLDKLGVSVDGVGTTPLSGQLRIDRPLGAEAKQFLQATIEHGYEEFLARVGSGRGKKRDEVNAIAQGRVWAGSDALKIGLVDRLGSLDDAIKSAAKFAKLADGDYRVDYVEPNLSWAQELALKVDTYVTRTLLGSSPALSHVAALAQRVDPLARELTRWQRMRAANNLYAYCFCQFE